MGLDPLGTNPFSQASRLGRYSLDNQYDIARTVERLSSGLRVNRAADDPSGSLRINGLQANLIGNRQAIENTQDAGLMSATATEGARQILSQLERMREIATISLDKTTSEIDRDKLQKELRSLSGEIDRIARSTEFNGRYLLDGSSSAFKAAQTASSRTLINHRVTDAVSGLSSSFFSQIGLDPDANSDTVFEFRLFNDPNKSYTSLEVSASNQGIIRTYDYYLDMPTALSLPLTELGGPGLNVNRTTFQEPARTPLSNAELNTPIQALANQGRIDQVSYGNLALTAGGQVFSNVISVTANTTINDVLSAIDNLSGPNGAFSASYNSGTGRISVGFTGTGEATAVNNTSYTPAVPGQAGGAFDAFALITPPPEGPGYRNPDGFLPTSGFAVGSAQSYFPTLSGDISADVSFAGSNSSFLTAFGIGNQSGRGEVASYQTSYYGETVATGGQSEYVNRTRVTIDEVTAEQDQTGLNTGLNVTDADETFRVLNTAVIDANNFSAGDFTIDFGSNGTFTFAGFDPTLHSIGDIVTAINTFKPNNGIDPAYVSASFNDGSDTLSIINSTAPPESDSIVDDPGIGTGGTFTIDFGSNGIFSYNLQPGSSTIADFLTALNAHSGVTATFNATDDIDQFTINNTVSPVYDTKINNPGFGTGTLSFDFGSNGTLDLAASNGNLSINDVLDAISNYTGEASGGSVTASWDSSNDRLVINNTSADQTSTIGYKLTDPGIGSDPLQINFGSNGIYTSSKPLQDMTLNEIISEIDAIAGVTASYNTTSDSIELTNTAGDIAGTAGVVNDPGFTSDDLILRFRVSNTYSNYQTYDFALPDIQNATINDVVNWLNGIQDVGGVSTRDILADWTSDDRLTVNVNGVSYSHSANLMNAYVTFEGPNAAAFTNFFKLGFTSFYDGPESGSQVPASYFYQSTEDIAPSASINPNTPIGSLINGTPGSTGDNQITFLSPGANSLFKIPNIGDTNTDPNSSADNINSLTGTNIDNANPAVPITSALNIDEANGDLNRTISELINTPVTGTTPGNNQIVISDSSTGLKAALKLTDATDTGTGLNTLTGANIDKAGNPLLNIDEAGGDLNRSLQSLATTQIYLSGGTDNRIDFSAGLGERVRDFFKLSEPGDNSPELTGTYTQSSFSSAPIDNGNVGSAYDITLSDVSSKSFQDLVTEFSSGTFNNQIIFGGVNGANIRNVFNLNDVASDDTVIPRTNISTSAIDRGDLDSSLELNATQVTGSTLSQLLTPRLNTLVTGPLVIDGNTVINIDPDTDTLNKVIDEINAYSGPSNKTYTASFSSGQLSLKVTDTETITPSGASLVASPNEASPRFTGNQLVFDSAAYVASTAPKTVGGVALNPTGTGPAEQALSTSPLDSRYSVVNPSAPADLSSISWGGTSNLASILYLGNVGSGNVSGPTVTQDEYQGVISVQGPGTNSYNLEATNRRQFEASSVSTSSQIIGRNKDRLANDELGIVARIQTFAEEAGSNGNALGFQLGDSEGDTLNFGFADLTAQSLRVETLNLVGENTDQTRRRSINTFNVIEKAIQKTLTQTSRLGAFQLSVDSENEALASQREALTGSLEAWQNTDITSDVRELTRQQLVAQTGNIALSQNFSNTQRLFDALFDALPGSDNDDDNDTSSGVNPATFAEERRRELQDKVEQGLQQQLARTQADTQTQTQQAQALYGLSAENQI